MCQALSFSHENFWISTSLNVGEVQQCEGSHKSGLFHLGNGRWRVVCLIDVHCSMLGGPVLVSAKPPTKSFWISSLSHSGYVKVVREKNVRKIFTSNGKDIAQRALQACLCDYSSLDTATKYHEGYAHLIFQFLSTCFTSDFHLFFLWIIYSDLLPLSPPSFLCSLQRSFILLSFVLSLFFWLEHFYKLLPSAEAAKQTLLLSDGGKLRNDVKCTESIILSCPWFSSELD